MASAVGWKERGDRMAKMVDIGDKDIVKRVATATGRLVLRGPTLEAISSNKIKKGDVISASKLAGIQAAKATSTILPLCHQIPLTSVEIDIVPEEDALVATCTVSAVYRTGVEMESLVGVTAALLNAWDMVKYLEKDSRGQYSQTVIEGVRVVTKTKGDA
jgi:cyclic pyranopterin phosphate synthase